ncbi:MAG: hypothetical protein K1X79_06100 [Oligoflexia bacterium]|nr:hypothetical protein [Oligoflexia bacterium]
MDNAGGTAEIEKVKGQILAALSHPEAEEGLYFRNFYHLHEEDERPQVCAEQIAILDALKELIADGKVRLDETGDEAIFFLN